MSRVSGCGARANTCMRSSERVRVRRGMSRRWLASGTSRKSPCRWTRPAEPRPRKATRSSEVGKRRNGAGRAGEAAAGAPAGAPAAPTSAANEK
eukprot:scaffold80228_cov68-Phaeocystis_antarctica.AAC.7